MIEEGPQKGSFVYKTLDRVTGEVVRQLPREDVVRLMDAERYSSGAVIDTLTVDPQPNQRPSSRT